MSTFQCQIWLSFVDRKRLQTCSKWITLPFQPSFEIQYKFPEVNISQKAHTITWVVNSDKTYGHFEIALFPEVADVVNFSEWVVFPEQKEFFIKNGQSFWDEVVISENDYRRDYSRNSDDERWSNADDIRDR